jgi:DNA-nicking Smr family endonuclease
MVKDADLFAAAMSGVKPLKSRRPVPRAKTAAPKPAVAKTIIPRAKPEGLFSPPQRSGAVPAVPELSVDDQNFDRDISRSLSRGRLVPQASLDLHGMTLAGAERAVAGFLDQAVARDLRVVLVVTGKGLRLEAGRLWGGRIRGEFIGWLNRADNRQRVRAVRPAHPRHGGGGAFYVLLRRRSSASSRSLRATPQR